MGNKIFLIGFMGSGKTTVGNFLSQKLKYKFVDTDEMIEKNEKKSIAEIFKSEGESYFRDLELSVIDSINEMEDDVVISTGGGLPCFNDLIQEINDLGLTIYLECSERVIYNRIKDNLNKRPLIEKATVKDSLDFIRKKLNAREGIYKEAKIIVNGENLAKKVVDDILEKLKLQVE